METITVERTIDAPAEAVFDWISHAPNYTRARLVLSERLAQPGAEAPYGTGALRNLVWAVGIFSERITAYDRPHCYDYDVEKSFPPAEHKFGRVSFDEVTGGTHVVWTTTFALKFPLIGALATKWIAGPILAHVFDKVLDAATADLSGTRVA